MDKTPKFLYRFFDKEKYALDFLNHGRARLGTLKYYASIEDASRRDSSEGVAHFKALHRDDNGDLVNTGDEYWNGGYHTYIFCTSSPDVNLEKAKKQWGHYIVKIKYPNLFLKAVEKATYPFTVKRSLLKQVSYSKGEEREVDVSYCDEDCLSAWQKPKTFKNECEYRFILITDKYSTSDVEPLRCIEWKDTSQYLEKFWD
jgi:hypothetical protein